MKNIWKNNSLSIVMFGLFALFLGGQIATGYQVNNEELQQHGQAAMTLWEYLKSGHFGEALFENWESEFLQMSAYVFLTVFLYQKGSAESKDPGKFEHVDQEPEKKRRNKTAPWPVRAGGWALAVYKNSLGLAFAMVFIGAFVLHGIEGARAACSEAQLHGEKCETATEYMMSSQFWFESFQNWQSEFLAVWALIVLSIFLRQQGSPESKPVAASNMKTGEG